MRTLLPAAPAALFLLLLAPAARAEEPHAQLIETKAEAIVSVKYTLSVQISRGGQTMDREFTGTSTGVIVDPVGLIVVPGQHFAPQVPGMDITSTPTSLRVIFPGDPKEYDAILGATDARLGLAFLRIKDLEGRKAQAIDLANAAEPKVGDTLYGVSRLSQGFDYAPYCDDVRVVGHVSKPRKMWLLQGRFTDEAHPVFTGEGAVAGWVIGERGVGEQQSLPFLLPLKVALSTFQRAGREAVRVLEEAREREAEGGEGTTQPPAGTLDGEGEGEGEGEKEGEGEGEGGAGEEGER